MDEEKFSSIPRTEEEMVELRKQVANKDLEKLVSQAHKHNARIDLAKRMMRMFESDEFKIFWEAVHTTFVQEMDHSVAGIKGSPETDGKSGAKRYDPLGQLVQLNNIQGGLEVLDSQAFQKAVFEKTATDGKEVDINELKAKLNPNG